MGAPATPTLDPAAGMSHSSAAAEPSAGATRSIAPTPAGTDLRTLDPPPLVTPPPGQGLSVRWESADLDLTDLDRANLSVIVRVSAGYLAWGHGSREESEGAALGGLSWRSRDGRVWQRAVVSGPSGVVAASSGPLGIIAISGRDTWWSQDGTDWTRGDLASHEGDPGLWDVAVGREWLSSWGPVVSWMSRDGLRWESVTGDRMDGSRIYAVDTTAEGFLAVGEEDVAEDLDGHS